MAKMDVFIDKLARAVKEARKERKLTQEKLGEIIGCDGQTIGQIERRQTNPEFSLLTPLIRELNLDVVSIF